MVNAIRGLVFASGLALVACHRNPGPAFAGAALLTPSTEDEAAHDQLMRADLDRTDTSQVKGLADGMMGIFTDNVFYLRGGLPIVRGAATARAVMAADPRNATVSVRWQPVRAETSADRNHGFTYGYTVLSMAQPNAPSIRVDRYIAYWIRDDAAKPWRIAAYAETYEVPPPAVVIPDAFTTAIQADVAMSRMRTPLDALRSADEDFSRDANKNGAGDAFGKYAADDAQMFSATGEFLTGPQAIAQSFGVREDRSSFTWHPVDGAIAKSGDLGFTVGNAVYATERADGTKTVRYSKYLTVWRKQKDGTWRYVVDGGSARPAR